MFGLAQGRSQIVTAVGFSSLLALGSVGCGGDDHESANADQGSSDGDPSGGRSSNDAGRASDAASANAGSDATIARGDASLASDAAASEDDAGAVAAADASVDAGVQGSADAGSSARPYKGVANSPCAARGLLNVSWYYNWEQGETEACKDGTGGKFVPMIWGHANEQSASAIASALSNFVKAGYTEVLGFNEPDNSTQSNIGVDAAIKLWPAFDVKGLQVGSPASQANQSGQTWFKSFVGDLEGGKNGRADFLAIHWYGWNAGSCDAKASQLESYIRYAEGLPGNRPIWLTEWGCLNQSAPDEQTVVTFFTAAAAMLAKHPRVERYAWYPWSTNNALNDDKGALTALGKVYAAQPAYH